MLSLSVPHFPQDYSRHYVLSGGTQRRAFALIPVLKYKNIKSTKDRNRNVTVTPASDKTSCFKQFPVYLNYLNILFYLPIFPVI